MGEPIAEVGYLAGVCGDDGTDWEKVGVSASGRLKVETEASDGTDLKDLLDKLDDCLTALEKIDDLQNALDSVGTDELDVNVEASVLPTGAATSANQTTMITALQLIDDLRAALDSVGTDELDVMVEGYDPVPTNPVGDSPDATSVTTSTWTDIGSLSVSTGKTLYLTDYFISDGSSSAGVEFYYRVYADGAIQISGHMGAGFGVAEHLQTPVKATSGNEVAIHVYQWSGSSRWYQAAFVGFEV